MLSVQRLELALFLNEQSLSDIANSINMPEDDILNNIKKHDIDTCKILSHKLNTDYRWLMGQNVPMNEFIKKYGIKLLEDTYLDWI